MTILPDNSPDRPLSEVLDNILDKLLTPDGKDAADGTVGALRDMLDQLVEKGSRITVTLHLL